jgi:hypothetical protein
VKFGVLKAIFYQDYYLLKCGGTKVVRPITTIRGKALLFRLHGTHILKAKRAYFSETLSYLPKGKVSEHRRQYRHPN